MKMGCYGSELSKGVVITDQGCDFNRTKEFSRAEVPG